MNTRGRHLLVEYTGCDPHVLNDVWGIEQLMMKAVSAAKATLVASVFRPFAPQGVTGVVVVEESHLSIHTWPEHGYAAVDFYTCGDCLPERAHEVLAAGLRARCAELMQVERGAGPPGRMLKLRGQRTEMKGSADPGVNKQERAHVVS